MANLPNGENGSAEGIPKRPAVSAVVPAEKYLRPFFRFSVKIFTFGMLML